MDVAIGTMTPVDWPEVRAIYREGLATGLATFETEAPSWEQWDAGHLPACRLLARRQELVLGWAALSAVSRRPCYGGVAEISVYVGAAHRGSGVGRALLRALVEESERLGFWTLQGATFAENAASLRIQTECGFRVVGRRERIAQLGGVWKDTVLTERRSAVVGAIGRGGKATP
jgi:L-amino acid N-acyltransferase YncA